ncbi:hypothetical protein D3C72_1639660 [compost metagenome]
MGAVGHRHDQREPQHVGPVDGSALEVGPPHRRADVDQQAVKDVTEEGQPDRCGDLLPAIGGVDRDRQQGRDRQHEPHASHHERIRRQAGVDAGGGAVRSHGDASGAWTMSGTAGDRGTDGSARQ